ncbi:MAG: hypothetical protein HKN12_10935, partial [Gemmatimonadetes bacterium]|nr:hypothetical protein [Gemmatimonadota bacterium]
MAAIVRVLPFLLLSLYMVVPLARVDWFENHETTSYLARTVETVVCWADGDLRARWFPDFAAGFGLPYLSFYAPLTFWGGAFFHQFGADVPTALKVVIFVAALLAMSGAYRLAREATARGPALAGALLYVYSPYTVRNVYVRGDLAEYLAMAFLPWALYGLVRAARRPGVTSALIAGAGGAGAILSHNIMGMLVGLAMALTAIVVFFTTERARRKLLFPTLTMGGAAALLLSQFFWMPALAEKDWTNLSALQEGFFSASQYHLAPSEIFGLRGEPRVHTPGEAEPLGFELRFLPWLALLGLAAA